MLFHDNQAKGVNIKYILIRSYIHSHPMKMDEYLTIDYSHPMEGVNILMV